MYSLQKLPVTRSGFESIIEEDLLYVDKTEQIFQMLGVGQYLFLSKPRRFGKSLMVTTLQALYQGKKELFKGLYIYDKWDWQEHAVIRIDFGGVALTGGPNVLKEDLTFLFEEIADDYGVSIRGAFYSTKLRNLIKNLYKKTGQKVVILIDEYDKPITNFIDNPDKADTYREVLKEFYTMLKSQHDYLEKVFITGVSKFAKVSVFSGMNNAKDIGLLPEFNDLVGLTQADIEHYFGGYLSVLAEKENLDIPALLEKIRFWYNGYSWDGQQRVYNPFSIVNLFDTFNFENFWYQSGTPTMLVNLITKRAQEGTFSKQPMDYRNVKVTKATFQSAEIRDISIESLLFQTGYLTVTKMERDDGIDYYTLDYPNHEVRWSFIAHILQRYAKIPQREIEPGALRLKKALRQGEEETFIILLRKYFALIPYQLRYNADEAYYHSLFQMLFTLVGIEMLSERSTDKGRIDGVIEFEDKICLLEFKHKRSGTLATLTNNALKQIETKKYTEAYVEKGRPIYLIGVGFLEKHKDAKGKILLEIDAKWKVYK